MRGFSLATRRALATVPGASPNAGGRPTTGVLGRAPFFPGQGLRLGSRTITVGGAPRAAAQTAPATFGYGEFIGGEDQIRDLKEVLGAVAPKAPNALPALEAAGDPDSISAELDESGAILLEGAVAPEAVAEFAEEHRRLYELVADQLEGESMKPRGENFYKAYTALPGGLQLRANAKGRFELRPLDRRDAGSFVREQTRVSELVEPLICPASVRAVLDRAFPGPWRVQAVGSLPAVPGASGGDWHRDVGTGLFCDEALELSLPDYFFIALLPLEAPLTLANGSEVVLGSHRRRATELGDLPRAVAAGKPGDVALLNGKIVHRGLPNEGSMARPLLYVAYTAPWYETGRDAAKEFWQRSSSAV